MKKNIGNNKAVIDEFDADDLTLISLAQDYQDEDRARELFEKWRWQNGKPICPHCKFDEAYKIVSNPKTKNKARKGLYCCAACRKTFTATVGTVLESSRIPISKWLMAIFILCSSKKSISANQLSRMLKVTLKTAWFLAHRIRFAMTDDNKPLTGVIEIDETYIGGKSDCHHKYSSKTPVIALIERGGNMKARVLQPVTHKNLGKVLSECVGKDVTVNTDQAAIYKVHAKNWKRHDVVNHSKFEYSRKNADGTEAGINTCESFFSLLKRGVYGSWHHIDREHLPKYVNEFSYRWNTRHDTDGERMRKFMPMIDGKRLTYRQVV